VAEQSELFVSWCILEVLLSIDLFLDMVVSSEAYNSKVFLDFWVQVEVPVRYIRSLQAGQ